MRGVVGEAEDEEEVGEEAREEEGEEEEVDEAERRRGVGTPSAKAADERESAKGADALEGREEREERFRWRASILGRLRAPKSSGLEARRLKTRGLWVRENEVRSRAGR